MNHQQQSLHQSYPPQVYPLAQLGIKPAGQTEIVPERQCCGYTLAVFGAIASILTALNNFYLTTIDSFEFGDSIIVVDTATRISWIVVGLGYIAWAVFLILAVAKPDYLGGKPKIIKLLPYVIGSVLIFFGGALANFSVFSLFAIIPFGINITIAYFMFLGDDDSGSCCLCFKPWVMKTPVPMMYAAPQYGGYPIPYQQAYPIPQQQAYPTPQQQAYPMPQQQAYPAPQQQANSPQ